jgi:hypothetical protein
VPDVRRSGEGDVRRWLTCEVPFCLHKRGRRKGEAELTDDTLWICAEHWKMVPAQLRRRMRLLDRLVKKAEAKGAPFLVARFRHQRHTLWLEARRLAIEIAAGITAR